MTSDGVHPVLLLSLPRSGSTLLQRLLGAHPEVATAPEPWMLLPFLYALRPDDVYAEYGHRVAVSAVAEFLDRLPDGVEDYRMAVRDLATQLYTKASYPSARYFIDKTPRYALVAEELLAVFPNAPVIVLWRNPLSVVTSIADSWTEGRWMPYLHKADLFTSIERLTAAAPVGGSRMLTLRYEDLVLRPEEELRRVVDHLGLAWDPAVLANFGSTRATGVVGDRRGVQAYATVSADSLDRWKASVSSPVRKRWCRRYLNWIGHERLAMMGYDLLALQAQLDAVPSRPLLAAPDAALALKGMLHNALEPDIIKRKLRLLPHWHRVQSHS